MKSVINWHETAKELPEPKKIIVKGKSGKEHTLEIDEWCLVIWNNRIKPSRWLHEEKKWDGHTKDQIPAYWVKYDEIGFVE